MSQPQSFSTAPAKFEMSDFMQTNSIVARVAFLIFAVFIFIIVLRVGIGLLSYFLIPTNVKLMSGMIDAKEAITYNQDPSGSPYTAIPRSANEDQGIEFTWSCWIYIKNLKYLEGQYRHVFYKGNNNLGSNGINEPNNAPGLYIAPHTNALVVLMSTFNEINKEVVVPDIPMNKWVNVIIRVQNKTLDVYINGTIARSIQLGGVPKQNDGSVYVAANGGFDGNISNLWYYDHGVSINEIQSIMTQGPNTNMIGSGDSAINNKDFDYLSMRWFIRG